MAVDLDKKRVDQNSESGFALIFVLVFVAAIIGIVAEIVYQTTIAARSSMSMENELQAEATAQTGVEFAKLLLSLNAVAAGYQNNPMIPLPKDLYKVLNGQPIGIEGLEEVQKLSGMDFSKALAPEILAGLKDVKGYFVINVTSESAKFNLNLLQNTYSDAAQKALLRIFSTPDSQKFLDLYGYTAQEVVADLTSYIKTSQGSSGDGMTQADYTAIGAKYKPKHAALETLEELRRIPKFNMDTIYDMYSPYFTIWPLSGNPGTLNINSAAPELVSALMTPAGQEIVETDWDKFDNYRNENTFDKNNMGTWFSSNFSQYSSDKDNDDIRKAVFGTTDTIFRVESRGIVNGLEKKLVVILAQENKGALPNQGTQPQNGPAQNPNQPQGNPQQPQPNQQPPQNGAQQQPNQNQPNNQSNNNQPSQNSNQPGNFQVIYSQWE